MNREEMARKKADLPIERGMLAWAVVSLLVSVFGVAVIHFGIFKQVLIGSGIDNLWIGLVLVLSGVSVSTIITSAWHNEMSLRNLGSGLRTLDALSLAAQSSGPRKAKPSIAPEDMPLSALQLKIARSQGQKPANQNLTKKVTR
jgi:uncharacterized membrane protein YidH (DUF202 family)